MVSIRFVKADLSVWYFNFRTYRHSIASLLFTQCSERTSRLLTSFAPVDEPPFVSPRRTTDPSPPGRSQTRYPTRLHASQNSVPPSSHQPSGPRSHSAHASSFIAPEPLGASVVAAFKMPIRRFEKMKGRKAETKRFVSFRQPSIVNARSAARHHNLSAARSTKL